MAYSYSESRFAYLAIIVSELSFCIIFTSDWQFFFKVAPIKKKLKNIGETIRKYKSVRFPQAVVTPVKFLFIDFF